jgi:hypothetical protein
MTATEDRMREAFDAEHDDGRTLVQIAATVADQMVAEATAEIRKQHAEMLAALKASVELADRNAAQYGTSRPRTDECQAIYEQCVAAIAAAEASGTGG